MKEESVTTVTVIIHKNIKADFFFCIGYDEYRRYVLSVYYIPNESYISKLNIIHINLEWDQVENPYYWFKENPKPWDDLFHTLKLESCPILRSRRKK